ncbi:Zinc finger protein [Melia azedarach]|uniref:Zinc finger protein n=1 Tax=Melia azedarach TaxID=155640 RepID=A0ACC1YAG5_MELAZ|nr:Zinc finger protein [Melia azedarach]
MEENAANSYSSETNSMDYSTCANEREMPTEQKVGAAVFVNHAEIAWHESRRKWVGDQSQRPDRMAKDPIISWSTTYEELLSNNQPFSEPIPLPEMVDFLVDIWHDQGLFD